MSVILQARVEQKTDTEANWLANPLILLAGECAFVKGSSGMPINFKIGDGTKRFSDLPYWIDYAQSVVVPPIASGGTLPVPDSAGKIMILGHGTYNQPTTGAITFVDNSFNVIMFDGAVWITVLSIVITLDANGYYTKTQINDLLSPITGVNPSFSFTTNNTLSGLGAQQVASTTTNYYNNWPSTQARTVTKITLPIATAGSVMLVKFSSSNVPTDISSINTTVGNNGYDISVNLAAGEKLGVRKISGSLAYSSTGGIGAYGSDSGTVVANLEIGYAIAGYYPTGGSFDTLTTLTSKVATNTTNISNNSTAIATNTTNISSLNDSVTSLIGLNPVFVVVPNNDYSIITQSVATSSNYYNIAYPTSQKRIVNKIKVKMIAAGDIMLVKFSTANISSDITSLTAAIGTNEYTISPITLLTGEKLGIRRLSGTLAYKSTLGGGLYTETGTGTGTTASGVEVGYSYSGYYPTGTSYDTLTSLTTKVANLNASVFAYSAKMVELFGDDMTTQKSSWVLTGWSYSTGAYTNTGLGMANRLDLNKPYHVDKRNGRFIIRLSSDSDLRIHCKYGSGNAGEGASLFGVNASTNKITIFAAQGTTAGVEPVTSTGVSETTVLTDLSLPFTLSSTKDYLIQIFKDNITSKISITDTLTGDSAVLSYTGWSAGRQNENYGFYVYAGGSVSIKGASILTLYGPDYVIVGDSIDESVMVIPDRNQDWSRLFRANVNGVTVISARGGDTIDGVITKFDTEYSIYRPKNMFLKIGTNGGLTGAKIQQVIDLCASYNIKLYWCYIPCKQSSDGHIAVNTLIAATGLRGLRFDIATALDNNPIPNPPTVPAGRYNPAIYYDTGTHPNTLGQQAMFKRVAIDTPEVLKQF